MSKVTPKNPPLFEHTACGRCCGSGSYSWNQMHGSVCYGCSGSGWALTKRGRAAQRFLDDMRKVRADSIKVGDLFFDMDYGFRAVTSIMIGPAKELGVYQAGHEMDISVRIETAKSVWHFPADHMVRKGWSGEEKAAHIKAALAYQATLTKAGVPAKVKGKAAA